MDQVVLELFRLSVNKGAERGEAKQAKLGAQRWKKEEKWHKKERGWANTRRTSRVTSHLTYLL